jgi:phosphoglycolate phosphatase
MSRTPHPTSRALGFRQLGADVKQVVWDWNGTLLDDHEHCIDIMNGLLREHGLSELDVARYRTVFDFPVRLYYERLGFSLDEHRWRVLASRFIEEYDRGVHSCSLHTGAADLLSGLVERGVQNTILSAAKRTSVEELLGRFRLREYFEDVVGLDDHYAAGKTELGLDWLGRSSSPRDSIVLVGDTVHDFEVAEAMGIRCVLVAAGHHARDRLERCGCPVVSRLTDLFE